MKKKFLLFDADRTLLDFSASERKSLQKTFAEYGLPFSDEMYQYHLVNNARLWENYEKGLIDRQAVLYCRFVQLFAHFHLPADGIAFEDSYRKNLTHSYDLMSDALEVVQNLSRTHALYIVTNGVSDTQKNRMKGSGLNPYFRDIFISEDIGSQKPQKEFFARCLARIPDFDPALSLIIGDSLTSDILGGNQAGIQTCWFNPTGEENHTAAKVDAEIRHLKDLYPLLEVTPEKQGKPAIMEEQA
ncbi:MAG: YjjG family noncanonical pyrimidine nucleotidase [Anaerotignum sp.]|nr:YjjG family noncanonical pyrimidine nucleotidase [Anaerotignum sp.]